MLSITEVAERWGVSRWTVRRRVLAGRLRAYQDVPNGPWRFRERDVADYEATQWRPVAQTLHED